MPTTLMNFQVEDPATLQKHTLLLEITHGDDGHMVRYSVVDPGDTPKGAHCSLFFDAVEAAFDFRGAHAW